ncbi:MAG: Tfp pilus assembly protein FimT/FimU [Clostridia bacterium]
MTREKGMTLIALVITIIVLLILVGVSIATLTGDNGIITQVNNSKIETVIGTVKEQLKLLQTEKRIGKEKLTPETLLAEGKAMRRVKVGGNDKYYMYYALKEDSFEGMQGLGKGDLTSMEDVFLIDDDLNVKYIARSRKEYGDEIKDKILEDETEIRFSSKAFSEYISKISGVSENELKFKWMKNQTSLRIIDSSIDTLNDLVFFPNLTSLIIGDENGNCPAISTLDGVENCLELTSISIIGGIDKEYMSM